MSSTVPWCHSVACLRIKPAKPYSQYLKVFLCSKLKVVMSNAARGTFAIIHPHRLQHHQLNHHHHHHHQHHHPLILLSALVPLWSRRWRAMFHQQPLCLEIWFWWLWLLWTFREVDTFSLEWETALSFVMLSFYYQFLHFYSLERDSNKNLIL